MEPDLRDPRLYLNRKLGYLEFNARVLAQARDPAVPLLERLRFLTICSTNLDQFFEIRVAGLKQQAAYGAAAAGPDGMSPQEQLATISGATRGMVAEQYRILDELLAALAERGIRVLRRAALTAEQRGWMLDFFHAQVQPVLTPVGLDPAHPFPRVLNKALCFAVWAEGADAFGRRLGIAVVQVPRSLPRLIPLPRELVPAGGSDFVLLSSVVHEHVGELFPGMAVSACYQFRVTRNSDLFVDEEEVEDLLHALRGELPSRNYGEAVRLEVDASCSREIAEYLQAEHRLDEQDTHRCAGPVNLGRLGALYDMVDRPDLKYPPFVPALPRRAQRGADIFEAIRQGDLLLHHPFESFRPVVELVRQAAADPNALAVKQTLYRTGAQSPVVDALIEAARAGREVTAVVELRARFD